MAGLNDIELDQLRALSAKGNLSPSVQVKLDDYIAQKAASPGVTIDPSELSNPVARSPASAMQTEVIKKPVVDLYGVTPEPAYGGGTINKASPTHIPNLMTTPSPSPKPNTSPAPKETPKVGVQSTGELLNAVNQGKPIELGDLVSDATSKKKTVKLADPMAGLNKAYNMQEMGILGQADAQAKQAEEQYQAGLKTQETLAKLDAANAERDQKRDQERQKWEDEFHKAQDDFQATKIDPNHYWSNISTGKKILWGISAFFSGLGSRNGQNVGLDMLKDTINSDIAAQKADYDKKKYGMDVKQTMYSRMMERFGNERQAEAATRARILTDLQLQNQGIASKYASPEVKAKAIQLNGVIEKERGIAKATFDQAANARALKESMGANPKLEALDEKDRERYATGQGFEGLAPTSERAKNLTALGNDVKNSMQSIDKLLSLKDKNGLMPSEAKAAAEVERNLLKGSLRTIIVGPGAVSETEQKILDSAVSNPTDYFQINNTTRLKTLKMILQKKLKNAVEAEGMKYKGQLDLTPNE